MTIPSSFRPRLLFRSLLRVAAFAPLAVAFGCDPVSTPPSDAGAGPVVQLSSNVTQAIDAAKNQGRARVLVTLRAPFTPESDLADVSAASFQRDRIESDQEAVLTRLGHPSAMMKGLRRFEFTPHLALEATPDELEALAAMPEVSDVRVDGLRAPALAVSVPLVGASPATLGGDDGAGQTVAILDTGVDATGSELAGKIVAEACYSANLCPGGVTSSTATGSGRNCTGVAGCEHGTNVAGVAAGRTGVASSANIISIQVYSRFDDAASCAPSAAPCLRARDSDIIAGLQQVYALRSKFKIVAVNLSATGGHYTTACDTLGFKPAIDNLRGSNIATIIASGNDALVNGSYQDGIAAPACTSTAISVGSTKSGDDKHTGKDSLSSFSQSAPILSLLAPGEPLNVPDVNGGHRTVSGTSFAAAHVTGAWAIMRTHSTSQTITSILSDLKAGGTSIADQRFDSSGQQVRFFARLNVGTAIHANPNLALNRPVTSSGNTCNTAQGPENAVNGVGGDKWCAFGTNQWLTVDLGAQYLVKQFDLKHAGAGNEDPAYNTKDFKIDLSRDGASWTNVVNVTGNKASVTSHTLSSAQAGRYVRLTAVNPVNSQLVAARIYEFQIFGEPGSNLALNKKVTSSALCDASEGAAKAVNGSIDDKWCSNDPTSRWLKVDLGAQKLVNRVVIKHASTSIVDEDDDYDTRDYNVEVSLDDQFWTRVIDVTGANKVMTAHALPPTAARYVRLNVTNGGSDGVARIYELEVYGLSGTNAALKKTATSTPACSTSETAPMAFDGLAAPYSTKWCSTLSDPTKYWLQVDLGASTTLKWFTLRHAGFQEIPGYNTKNFTIQTSNDNATWTTVVAQTNNTANITAHAITPVSARYLKLNITAPSVNGDSRARIYEFEAYK
jgi:hypothetical protein